MSDAERQEFEKVVPSRNKWLGDRYDHDMDQRAWEAWLSAKKNAAVEIEQLRSIINVAVEEMCLSAEDQTSSEIQDRLYSIAEEVEKSLREFE